MVGIRLTVLFSIFAFFLFASPIYASTQVNLFQVTTDGSQQKDAFVYKDLVAYDSLSDIWGYNLETKENFPLIQKDGQQYITHLYKNLVVYQDIPLGSIDGDIRIYNVKTGMDTLIIGGPNSYSSGGTNGNYVIYLDGGACGSLYAYNIHKKQTEHLIDNVCTPKISDDIVYWSENAPGGPDIRGYNLKRKQYLDIATENGFQGPADMYDGKVVYIESDGGGFGSYMAVKVKNLRNGKTTTVYETNTNSINWPSISDKYVVWSEAPTSHVNSIKGVTLKTGEVFTVQEPGPHQNSHTVTSIWKNTAVWMSWRTGNGDIYGATFSK